MPQAKLKDVLDHFRKIFAIQDGRDLADGELIRRFPVHRPAVKRLLAAHT